MAHIKRARFFILILHGAISHLHSFSSFPLPSSSSLSRGLALRIKGTRSGKVNIRKELERVYWYQRKKEVFYLRNEKNKAFINKKIETFLASTWLDLIISSFPLPMFSPFFTSIRLLRHGGLYFWISLLKANTWRLYTSQHKQYNRFFYSDFEEEMYMNTEYLRNNNLNKLVTDRIKGWFLRGSSYKKKEMNMKSRGQIRIGRVRIQGNKRLNLNLDIQTSRDLEYKALKESWLLDPVSTLSCPLFYSHHPLFSSLSALPLSSTISSIIVKNHVSKAYNASLLVQNLSLFAIAFLKKNKGSKNKAQALKNTAAKALDVIIETQSSSKSRPLLGAAFSFSGRAYGAKKAGYFIISKGSVPYNTLNANIDYSLLTQKTRNGSWGFRTWLHFSSPLDTGLIKKNIPYILDNPHK